MKNIAKLPVSACPGCLITLLLLACSGGVDEPESDPGNASGSAGRAAESSAGGTGGADPLPPGASGGNTQAQAGAGGADNVGGTSSGGASGGGTSGAEGGSAGAPQAEPNTEGDAQWHCIGTMGDSACSCVLASTEPVAPYESGCPSDAQYGCCYTSETFEPDDACSCWTDSGLMQLGQTCEQLLQLAEAAGATRVDACSND